MTKKTDSSFEKNMQSLTELVQKMETGELPLEAALKAYEQGVALVQQCEKTLKSTEQKIKILQDNTLIDFDDA